MDIIDVGAAMLLTGGAATAANQAAEAANEAAGAANEAAGEASQAAAGYPNLDKDAQVDRAAFNFAYMTMQAELRDVQKRLKLAEAQIEAMA